MGILESLRENVFLRNYQLKYGEEAEGYLKFLLEGRVSRMAFMDAYKNLPPINEMPEKEKKEMKLYIHQLFPGESVEFKLEACKVLYTIGTLL